ncbi:hypothetical protein BKA69DRAFT_758002 [Paraphysoderma sedebokerense]|nr:hypothetical protein BKA69DRAFT_758002 [Paraphysoderma sedebokerense]
MADSQMQETMETLCENVAFLIETLDKRFKSMGETVQSMDGRFKAEGTFQSSQEQIDTFTQNICNNLEEVRKELKSEIRNLYKAVVRPSIAEKYGLRYAESLCLEDCYGLARLVAPTSQTSLEETEADDVLTGHQQRAFKIANRVKDGNLINKLKDKVDSYNREMAKLKESDPTITYNEYFKLTKDAEKLIAEWETGKDGWPPVIF